MGSTAMTMMAASVPSLQAMQSRQEDTPMDVGRLMYQHWIHASRMPVGSRRHGLALLVLLSSGMTTLAPTMQPSAVALASLTNTTQTDAAAVGAGAPIIA